MLSLSDRVSRSRSLGRRDFMQIGALGLGGLSLGLPAALASGTTAGNPTTGKSVVFLFQQGGPTQHETLDPKLDAPSGIATIGGDIATTVPGLRLGSSMQKLSKLAHRLAVVRNYQTNTGHGGVLPIVSGTTHGASIGSVYSRVAGTNHPETGLPNSMFMIPKSIDAEQKSLGERFGKFDATGSLGSAFAPFMPGGKGPMQEAMNLNLSRERFEDRRGLLKSLDTVRRDLNGLAETDGISGLRQQAADLILKGVADAFDLSKEDPRTLARYDTSGYYDPQQWMRDGGESVGPAQTPDDLLATISHTLFDYGQARLIPDLPAELKRGLATIEKRPGVLRPG